MSTEELEKRLRAAAPLRTPADLDARILAAAATRLRSGRGRPSRLPIAWAAGFAAVLAGLFFAYQTFDRRDDGNEALRMNVLAAAGRGFFLVGVDARFERAESADAIALDLGELTAESREAPLTVRVPGGSVRITEGRARIAVSEHEGPEAETEADRLGLERPRGRLVKTIVDLLVGQASCEAGDDVVLLTGPQVAVMPFDRVDGGILRLKLKAPSNDTAIFPVLPREGRKPTARPPRGLAGFVPEAYRGSRGRVGFLSRSVLRALTSDDRPNSFVSCMLPDDIVLDEQIALDASGSFSFAAVPDHAGAFVLLYDDRAPSALLIDPWRLPARPIEASNEASRATVVDFQGHRPHGRDFVADLSLTVRASAATESLPITFTTTIGEGRRMRLLGPPRETFEFVVEGSNVLRIQGERPVAGRGASQVIRLFEGKSIGFTAVDESGLPLSDVAVAALQRSGAGGRSTTFLAVTDEFGVARLSVYGTPLGIAAWSEEGVACMNGREVAALAPTATSTLALKRRASFDFRARAAAAFGLGRKASLTALFGQGGRTALVGPDGQVEFSATDSPFFSVSLGGKPVEVETLDLENAAAPSVDAPAFTPTTVRLPLRVGRDAQVELLRFGASILEATHELDRLPVAANGSVSAPMPPDMLALRFDKDVFHWRQNAAEGVVDFTLEKCHRVDIEPLPTIDGEPAVATAISPGVSGWFGAMPSKGSLSFLRPLGARSLVLIGNDRGAAAIVLPPGGSPRLPELPKRAVAVVVDTKECLVRRQYALCIDRIGGMDLTSLPSSLRIAATGFFGESGAFMARRLTPGAYTLELETAAGLVRLPLEIDAATTFVSLAY